MKLNKKIIAALGACIMLAPISSTIINQNAQTTQAATRRYYNRYKGHWIDKPVRDHRGKYFMDFTVDKDARLMKYYGSEWHINSDNGKLEHDALATASSTWYKALNDLGDWDDRISHVKFFNSVKSAEKYYAKYARRHHYTNRQHPLRIRFKLTADQWNSIKNYPMNADAYEDGKDAYCTKHDLDPDTMKPRIDTLKKWGKGDEGEDWDGDPRIYDVDSWNVW